ncbi:MAG TPA: hypothetical protein VEZ14_02285 [Dehalococcoidia bacterium]|nr:hypothetical protein [Dehalococcoidia bacterium]
MRPLIPLSVIVPTATSTPGLPLALPPAAPAEAAVPAATATLPPLRSAVAAPAQSAPSIPAADAPTPAPPVVAAPTAPSQPGTRDKTLWPFSSTGIWNMPIGSGAAYIPAGIAPASSVSIDEEFILFPSPADPLVPVYTNAIWGAGRCQEISYAYDINLPDGFVVQDAAPPYTPNAVAAILSGDGRTLKQMNPVSRCQPGGALTAGWLAPDQDIYGDGILGGHGGSGLSGIGGSIRLGELTGPDPIRHALKVNLWGQRWLSPSDGGFRWPAVHADASYNDPQARNGYGGALPQLRMGALLAIPPGVDISALGLKTDAARKLAWTMQNYGAYVVDNTTWDSHALDVQSGVAAEFRAAYGYGIEASQGPWFDDVMKIFAALSVVDNNAPSSVGGGGVPREPLAPPIGN